MSIRICSGDSPSCLARSTQRASEASSLGAAGTEVTDGASATNVPTPCRRTTSPWCSSSLNAFTTVFGLTDREPTTSFTLGSWSPGRSRPSITSRRTCSTSCR